MNPLGGFTAGAAGLSQADSVARSSLIRKLSKEGQAEERQNDADLEALKRNEFGPTRTQQEQMVADATQIARQQAQAARAEAARQRAASGYVMGAQAGQDAQIAAAGNQATGAARLAVSNAAAQQARQAKMEAFGRVKARAEKTEADVRSIRDEAHKGFEEGGGFGGVPSGGDATNLKDYYGKGG